MRILYTSVCTPSQQGPDLLHHRIPRSGLSQSGLLNQQIVMLTRMRNTQVPWLKSRAFLISSWRAQNSRWPHSSHSHRRSLKLSTCLHLMVLCWPFQPAWASLNQEGLGKASEMKRRLTWLSPCCASSFLFHHHALFAIGLRHVLILLLKALLNPHLPGPGPSPCFYSGSDHISFKCFESLLVFLPPALPCFYALS